MNAILDDKLSTNNITVVHTSANNSNMTLISCYVEPECDFEIFVCTLDSILSNIKSTHFLLGGDFNAKSILWGNTNVNNKGSRLEAFIAQHNLAMINNGTIPTFDGHQGQSIVDLTLASQSLLTLLANWHVSVKISLSDHNIILFSI